MSGMLRYDTNPFELEECDVTDQDDNNAAYEKTRYVASMKGKTCTTLTYEGTGIENHSWLRMGSDADRQRNEDDRTMHGEG